MGADTEGSGLSPVWKLSHLRTWACGAYDPKNSPRSLGSTSALWLWQGGAEMCNEGKDGSALSEQAGHAAATLLPCMPG